MIDNDQIRPDYTTGVPICSEDACPSFDGKRCKKLGRQPDRICEPDALQRYAQLKRLTNCIDRMKGDLAHAKSIGLVTFVPALEACILKLEIARDS